jgi:hypothetical protein
MQCAEYRVSWLSYTHHNLALAKQERYGCYWNQDSMKHGLYSFFTREFKQNVASEVSK